MQSDPKMLHHFLESLFFSIYVDSNVPPAGTNGTNGKDGKDGTVVTVSEDGYLVLDGEKTSTKVAGSVITVDEDGFVCIDGEKTEYKLPKGVVTAIMDGTTLTIKGASEEDIVIDLNSEVAVISAYYAENHSKGTEANFTKINKIDNTFGPKGGEQLTFKAGEVETYTAQVVVRVSPTNAKVNPEDISFINSEGQELSIVSATKVEQYHGQWGALLTKATSTSGLYVVTLKLAEDITADAINAQFKTNWGANNVAFAMAIENSKGGKAISAYDYTFSHDNFTPKATLDFTVDNSPVANLRNRYDVVGGAKEKKWAASTDDYPTPAAKEIVKDNVAKNTTKDLDDNRSTEPRFAAQIGKAMTIKVTDAEHVAGLYVTLDSNNAVESAPSEIVAWMSYDIVGLNTLVEGNEAQIVINDEAALSDEIGFRVFAVNLDGTLLDPDGKAFYAVLGNAAEDNATIQASIKATAATGTLTSEFVEIAVPTNTTGWTAKTKMYNDFYQLVDAPVQLTATYFKSNKQNTVEPGNNALKYVQFSTAGENMKKLIDGYTYVVELKYTRTTGEGDNAVTYPVKTVVAYVTKVMPTECPTLAFRPKQETEDGSGKFIAYMNVNDDKTKGTKDLDNVFYTSTKREENLENYDITISDADWKKANDPSQGTKAVTVAKDGTFSVLPAFIDSKTEHTLNYAFNYGKVSYKYYTKEQAVAANVGTDKGYYEADYTVAAEPYTVVLACWHSASTFAWKEVKNREGEVTGTEQPQLQWKKDGNRVTVLLNNIVSTNSYNNDYYGISLDQLLQNGLLSYALNNDQPVNPVLKYNDQVNPYFSVAYYTTLLRQRAVVFTQENVQADAAPVANHVEKLVFSVKDQFGHSVPVTVDVDILRPSAE